MMFEVTIKALDSQNHVFKVEEDTTVKEFKEKIGPTLGIPVEQQKLIFGGRVLDNDKPLAEYKVANNVVHVVQQPAIETVGSALRNLPIEWAETVEQDVQRQLAMPPQPSFSEGFNTLFGRKPEPQ